MGLTPPFAFFRAKLTVFLLPETEIAVTLKRLKIETRNSEPRCGTYVTTFVQI